VHGWAPVDVPAIRLKDRVLALFAADFLSRPEAFVAELHVCTRCESISFARHECSR
jgi:hypothetical protein